MSTATADVVIVAAGASRRMAGSDKLEADILGRPLLSWTLEQMSRASLVRRLVLVAAGEQVERLRNTPWVSRHDPVVVAGGSKRSDSVVSGVSASEAELVLVHDGARPLATPALADRIVRATAEHGAAIPLIPVVDSLKRLSAGMLTEPIERAGLARAQTPQGARRELLLGAFAASSGDSFSDEAALLQSQGMPVAAVPGEAHNIKVTEPADLALVRAIAADWAGKAPTRSGTAQDSHPFGPADGLWLGGLLFEQAPRLYGHSDGDVALHALASAMLAACGLGDLGMHFPPSDPSTSGVASSSLLAEVLEIVDAAGWRPSAAQVALLGARPNLGAERLEQMRLRMAGLLGLVPDALALTVSSGNLNGVEGAGLAFSATASVTLVTLLP